MKKFLLILSLILSCSFQFAYAYHEGGEQLTVEQTKPFKDNCADKAYKNFFDKSEPFRYYRGFVMGESTYSWFHGEEASQIQNSCPEHKESFSVILKQEFKNVMGKTKYKVYACEYTLDEGLELIRFNPGCDSASSGGFPFISEEFPKKTDPAFEEYYFYRDQLIIAHDKCL